MSDMQVQIELRTKDNLSKQAGTALDAVGKAARQLVDAIDAVGKDNNIQKMGQDATQAARSMDAVGREAHETRGELKGAERNANALQRSLSKVRDVGRDASKYMTQMGKGLHEAGKNASAFGTGVMAAGAVGKAALEKPVDREKALLEMANVAFDAKSGKRGKGGAAKLDSMVREAVKFGGGSYENAMQTTKTMFAAGRSYDEIKKILGPILKASTASASPGPELAESMSAGLKAGQFTVDQVPLILGQTVKSGSVGSFETKDISKHIAGIMTNAQDMLGVEGYSQHMASMQVMRDASGDSDEAKNLYANLQAYRLSPEASDKLKNKYKVNLGKELQAAAARGENLNMAFAEIIKKGVVEKDKKYKKLKARWVAAEGEEKTALDREMKVREGMLVGTIIGDRQARQAAIAMYSRRDAYDNYLQQIKDNPLAEVESQFQGMQDSTAAKATDAANTKDNATYDAFLGNKGTIDSGLSTVSDFFKDHPNLAVAASEATTLGAMATAGGAAWGGMKFLQGARGAGAASGAAQGTTALSWGARAGEATARTAKAAPLLSLGMSAYDIYNTENDATLTRNQKNINNMKTYGGFGGMLTGTAMGAAAGSAVPVLGTAIGALIGGIIGYLSGGKAGKATGQMIWGDESAPAEQPPQAPPPPQPIIIEQHNVFEVDGATLAEVTNRYNAREGARH